MSGKLYIVPTPIGNLDDLTLRAVKVLKEVDTVFCEDTRHSAKLLSHIGSKARRESLHEHNESDKVDRVLSVLQNDLDAALISDAGTPTISDPGFILVRECRKRGMEVVPLPGACAAICALSASGLPTDQFVFYGFPPESKGKREKFFESASDHPATGIFYLSPHKAAKQLNDMLPLFSGRDAVLAREVTKLYEEFIAEKLEVLASMLNEQKPKGELVLMVSGKTEEKMSSDDIESIALKLKNQGLSGRTLAEAIKDATGLKKKEAYNLALKIADK